MHTAIYDRVLIVVILLHDENEGVAIVNRTDEIRRYIGTFTVQGEEIKGEVTHNLEMGVILLDVAKNLGDSCFIGKAYPNIRVITGKINTGATVTLFNNRCINNHTQVGQSQRIAFLCEYLIWSHEVRDDSKYNEFVCTLSNALCWSGLSVYDVSTKGIKRKEKEESREFSWFGVKVRFFVQSKENYWNPWISEDLSISQKLVLSLSCMDKLTINDFIDVRDKVLSLISFAIKDNINIDEEYLLDYDDSYYITDDLSDYHKHFLLQAHKKLAFHDIRIWDYNFTLSQIPDERDINQEIDKLSPVFNLYQSLFRYDEMPLEMIFLNIVQALETFHSRFFYSDKKKEYVESVKKRYEEMDNWEIIKNKLLSDTQMDENCNFIILVSRINDLFIYDNNTIFAKYWYGVNNYAQVVADTRHYYTHYGKTKEKKALKKEGLIEAIFVLRTLLEYHVCRILGIDIEKAVREKIQNQEAWKQLEDACS